jgi:hypothetical protein
MVGVFYFVNDMGGDNCGSGNIDWQIRITTPTVSPIGELVWQCQSIYSD